MVGASLAQMANNHCPRVLINLETVGNFGHRKDDTILLGKCDETVMELARELGWDKELMQLWEATRLKMEANEEPEDTADGEEGPESKKSTRTIRRSDMRHCHLRCVHAITQKDMLLTLFHTETCSNLLDCLRRYCFYSTQTEVGESDDMGCSCFYLHSGFRAT